MDEIKKVITIDTTAAVESLNKVKDSTEGVGQSFNSLKEYKQYIDKLRASLVDLDETSEEYKTTCDQISTAQTKLNNAIKAGGDTATAAEGSYNALTKQMADLKKQWKATTDEAERASIGKQISEINDKLKEFDESIGNYQRNVGNYEKAFTAGLTKITDGVSAISPAAGNAIKGFKGMTAAALKFIATPIGAVIAAIVVAVKALISGFKSSETATNKLKVAFAAFQPIVNAVKNIIGNLAEKVADIAVKLSEKLYPVINNITKRLSVLRNDLQIIFKSTKLFFESIKITALKVLTGIQDLYTDFLSNVTTALGKVLALLNIDIEASLQKAIGNQVETEVKLAEAQKERKKIEKEIENLIKVRAHILNEETAEAEKTVNLAERENALIEKRRKALVDEAKIQLEIAELKKKAEDKINYTDAERYRFAEKAIQREKDLAALRLSIAQEEFDVLKEKAALAPNDAAANVELAQAEANLYNIRKEYAEKTKELQTKLSELRKGLYNEWAEQHAGEIAKQEQEIALWEKKLEIEGKIAGGRLGEGYDTTTNDESVEERDPIQSTIETNRARLESMKEYEKGYFDILKEIENAEWLQEEIRLEVEGATDSEIETLRQAHNKRLEKMNKESARVQAESIAKGIETYANAMGDLFGSISDLYEEGSEEAKAFQIAQTTMNMLGGVVSAIVSAFSPVNSYLTIYGQAAMAAVTSASVIAAGIAQIAKIKQTTLSSSSSSSAASTSVNTNTASTGYTPRYTTNVTGQSETTNLANAIGTKVSDSQSELKVYVLEEDITKTQNKVKTQVREASF